MIRTYINRNCNLPRVTLTDRADHRLVFDDSSPSHNPPGSCLYQKANFFFGSDPSSHLNRYPDLSDHPFYDGTVGFASEGRGIEVNNMNHISTKISEFLCPGNWIVVDGRGFANVSSSETNRSTPQDIDATI